MQINQVQPSINQSQPMEAELKSFQREILLLKSELNQSDQVDGKFTFNINRFCQTATNVLNKILTIIKTFSDQNLLDKLTTSFEKIIEAVSTIVQIVTNLANKDGRN